MSDNMCRSCKYWSVWAHAIGMGSCTNFEAHSRVKVDHFFTCQDFGCLLHESGVNEANVVSDEERKRIREEFENGRDYYALEGRSLRLPLNPDEQPSQHALNWHFSNRFLA